LETVDVESYDLGYPHRANPRLHPALIPLLKSYLKLGISDAPEGVVHIKAMVVDF
jgi:hypothetical protein